MEGINAVVVLVVVVVVVVMMVVDFEEVKSNVVGRVVV